MAVFIPPTEYQRSDDPLFGRFKGTETGLSVVRIDGVFMLLPYPWLGEIADLVEGVDWFQGGRSYTVTGQVIADLQEAGFTVNPVGYGEGEYGLGNYGGI